MIKKITLLKNYGVYKDFQWSRDSSLKDFKERNVIYGWNYSGKTTLSRVFDCLAKQSRNTDYEGGKFKIELHDSTETITESNFDKQNFLVEVFNSDYVAKNLNWDGETGVDPIQFDVGGGVSLRKELDEVKAKIERGQNIVNLLDREANNLTEFENTYSKESKRIKIDVFNSLIEFSKSHMKRVVGEIEEDIESYLLEEGDYSKHHKASLETNDKAKQNGKTEESIENLCILTDIFQNVATLLNEEPSVSNSIITLEQNAVAHGWVQSGMIIHNNEDYNDCFFCGQPLPEKRLNDLRSYFSNEASKLKNKIKLLKEELAKRARFFEQLELPKSKHDFVGNCQDRFEQCLSDLDLLQNTFKVVLGQLEDELDKKEENLFNSIDISDIDFNIEIDIKNVIKNINSLIGEHNIFIEEFETSQGSSRDILKRHLVAKFLLAEGYLDKKDSANRAKKNISIMNKILSTLRSRENKIESELKNVVAGKNELNNFIKLILNRDDVAIEVNDEDRFLLKRGEVLAKNLSEGEKTAISFSYFLVRLESLHREGRLVDTVVFIDDPISSLDSNHIAHVYSLINSFFFRKEIDLDDPNRFVNCFRQLFISTHNFEFFSFLKDSNRLNKKINSDPNKRCEYYFIERVNRTTSKLTALPKSLNMKSEYLHLFEQIFLFYSNGCDLESGNYILMPNAVRRFLELYTLIKLPGTKEEIDGRLNKLLGGVHQLKVLHHFSHFTSIEKIMRHDELVSNLKEAVEELMTLLKKDVEHYNSLVQAVTA